MYGKKSEVRQKKNDSVDDINDEESKQDEDDLEGLLTADELKEMFKIGNYKEPEKNRLMMEDLEEKQKYIIELLNGKEELEASIASCGCIHHIYVRIFM